MTYFIVFRRLGVTALFACLFALLPAISAEPDVPPYDRNEKPGPPPPVPMDDDRDAPQVQGRGPIHEGFAQPNVAPRAGPVAPKAPPEPIPEQPPDQKPNGDNVVWVPGYWSFDTDKNDWVWVSGFWRVPPAGRKWVPGYWTKTNAGWQWVNGFWAPSNLDEAPYAPEPPESLERGPSVPAPGDDYYYVPGDWLYQPDYSRFVWSPGFWCRPKPGFVWTPSRWSWTPRGFLHVSGFWDRDLAGRGVLFAPVHFPKPLWQQRGWAFQPNHVVPTRALMASLWVNPRAGTYAYGDYYGAKYARAGFQPWASYGAKSHDPLFGYYGWANRDNRNWQRNLVAAHQDRVNGDATLPPRTLAAQQRLQAQHRNLSADLIMAQPLRRFESKSISLTKVTPTDRTEHEHFAETVRKSSTIRRVEETRPLGRNGRPGALPLDRVSASTTARVVESRKIDQPAPSAHVPSQQPRQLQAVPKNHQPAPRVQTPSPQPRPQPQPRQLHEVPKNHQPAPRVQTPAPQANVHQPPPVQRQTPVPRMNVAPPAPRMNVAPPAPRMQAPHPPAPRPAPHFSGGHSSGHGHRR